MNKQEAKTAMREGKKVTHTTFGETNWAALKGLDTILFDDRNTCSEDDFWHMKDAVIFEDGWNVCKEVEV